MDVLSPDFAALFDASPNPYLVLDRSLHIAAANQAYLASTQRQLSDIVGRWAWDAFPTDPQTEAASVASFERVIRTGEPDTMPLWRFDVARPLEQGGGMERRYWSITHTPVKNAAGEVVFVLQNPIDVTELERLRDAEAATADGLRPQHSGIFSRAQSTQDANLQLKAESDRLHELFAQAPSFMAITRGPEHRIELTNQAYDQLIGGRDVIGLPVREVFAHWGEHQLFNVLDEVYSSGVPYVGHDQAICVQRAGAAGQERRVVDFVYQPIRNSRGDTTGIFVVGSDVTERFRAAEERARAEEKMRALAERQRFQLELADRLRPLTTAEAVLNAASELLGTRFNAARALYTVVDDRAGTFAITSDWTRAGIASVAGPVRRLSDFGREVLEPLRQNQPIAIDDVALDARTAGHLEGFRQIDVRAEMAIPLVKEERLQAVLVVHDDRPRAWTVQDVELARDVAERTWSAMESVHYQGRLSSERLQSQGILDSISEGFVLLERDWTILQINEAGARITERRKEDLLGKNYWERFPSVAGTAVEAMYYRVTGTGCAENLEYLLELPSGKSSWIELRAYPQPEGRLAVFFRDVSERKQAERELAEASRRKDEFLAMLAHELRNPLAPIRSAAAIQSMAPTDAERIQKTSAIITRQVKHMTSLVDDLLDVSRVTRGLVTLENERVDVKRVVHEAVEQVRPFIEERDHRLGLHLPSQSPYVMGDAKRLVQVFANLLNNAAKYTNPRGNIAVRMEVTGSTVVVKVSDNGVGMSARTAGIAFDLFAQGERTADRTQGGLGIGLALVKSLVKLHQGEVVAASAGSGQGSEFTVSLPRVPEQPELFDAGAEQAGRSMNGALRVLVVDDNKDAADTLAMLVETFGHRVEVHHDSRSALESAQIQRPHVCLLDIGLPDMDGNALARALRRQPATQDAMLVAVTGYGQDQDRAQTADAGFDHHLVKPVDADEIRAILAKAGTREPSLSV